MVNNNYSFLTVVLVALVVAVVVSLITASITGNVIKVQEKKKGTEVYTKEEVDSKLNNDYGCKWANNSVSYGLTPFKACQVSYNKDYTAKLVVVEERYDLFGKPDCPNNSTPITTISSNSIIIPQDLPSQLNGIGNSNQACSSYTNSTYSTTETRFMNNVLCCRP